jgi:dipeptidyl aminopeptidase/acylaminoacyl peptidase
LIAAVLAVSPGVRFASEQAVLPKVHAVSVADGITMARIAGTPYFAAHLKSDIAAFSPNGKYFTLVVVKGDLERNCNTYSILLFPSRSAGPNNQVRKIADFSSSSNRPGISEVGWLDDNKTVLFLGARDTEPTELYSVQLNSQRLTKLTNHPTSVVSYGISERGDEIVYAAEAPSASVVDARTLRLGFVVGAERIEDLLLGRIQSYEPQLFLRGSGHQPDKPLRTEQPFDGGVNDLFLSPDGHYLILKTDTRKLPERWSEYDDPNIRASIRTSFGSERTTRILQYELMDVRTGRSHALVDAPATYASSDVLWSPDSKSVLICGTYLPLNVSDSATRQERRTQRFVVEITLAGGKIFEISRDDLRPVYWNPQTGVVEFSALTSLGQVGIPRGVVYYRKSKGQWLELAAVPNTTRDERPEVIVDEDLDSPPRIISIDPTTGRRTTRLDLNPQFAQLAFGREKEIHWTTPSGEELAAGLYLPPNYLPGKRFPLVIQTHGFDPHGFWIDGPHTTVFAAQALAGRGFVVLQIDDIFLDSVDTPSEMSHVLTAYESAIDYLDRQGIIDHGRVGLVGFSRTCMYVKYALTHSARHFAAAVVADGIDAGYFQYLLYFNSEPRMVSEFEGILGEAPFGVGLASWLENSPGFSLDKVRTPTLIEALGTESIIGEWQWFDGLKRLGQPVEMLYLPEGTHVLVRPWDRMASEQTAVDWFCFWLNGQEADPARQDEYTRWRALRGQASHQ